MVHTLPHFTCSITKAIGTEKWTNVYYLSAADLTLAISHGDDIRSLERAIHKTTVSFTRMLVSEREQPFRNYSSIPLNELGLKTPTEDELPLPLWNTVRCEFQPSNSGKPDVKQLRLPLYTDEIASITTLTTTQRNFVGNEYAQPLVDLGFIEDDAGNVWTNGLARLEIHDRQLTKRRRKKVTV